MVITPMRFPIFFFNDTATTEIYTLSLHDALPILIFEKQPFGELERLVTQKLLDVVKRVAKDEFESETWLHSVARLSGRSRSEEHTSELQSPCNLVCRLLLEKKIITTTCTLIART